LDEIPLGHRMSQCSSMIVRHIMHLLHAVLNRNLQKNRVFPDCWIWWFFGWLARPYVIDFFSYRFLKKSSLLWFFRNTRKHVRKNLAYTAITRNLLKVRDNYLFIVKLFKLCMKVKRMLELSVLPIKYTFCTFLFSLLSLYRMKNPSPE